MEATLSNSLVLVAQAHSPGIEDLWQRFRSVVAKHGGGHAKLSYPDRAQEAYLISPAGAIAALADLRQQGAPPQDFKQLRIALGPAAPSLSGAIDQVGALIALANPGQILVAASAAGMVGAQLPAGVHLASLGMHRLRDLQRVEEVYQLSFPGDSTEFPSLNSLDQVPNNLPTQLTSFIGRRAALAAVAERLSNSRLVTLTGSGGSGKTRLALRVGAELLDHYPDGVWFVDLSSLSDPSLVPAAVAGILNVKEEVGRPTLDVLRTALADRRLLLLLDNCEHLITSCAHLVSQLLAGATRLSVLATSREPLSINGESIWPVPALSVPEQADPTPEALDESEAAQLFVHRARAVQPTFAITSQNAVAVATICRRLDGIPLALELAAARIRILSVQQIAERLNDRLRLLTAHGRTGIPRHQTLRAALDWSYELLTETERVFWCRLAVFGGSFALEAVEGICAWDPVDQAEVLDLLTSLVDKSLVVAEDHAGEKRYRLLESLRQYALVQVVDGGEEEQLFRRYCEWYISWSQQPDPKLLGPRDWLDRLEREHDNLQQALQWAIESRHGEYAWRLCAEIWYFWMVRGHTSAWSKLMQVADLPEGEVDLRSLSLVLRGVGALHMHLGNLAKSEEVLRRTLAMSRAQGDVALIMAALNSIGVVLQNTGRYEEALTHFAEAVGISEEYGLMLRVAWTKDNLGSTYYALGRLSEAIQVLEQSLDQQIALADQSGEAYSREYIGLSLVAQGKLDEGQTHLEASMQLRERLLDPRGIGASLYGLGELALRQGALPKAERLLWQSLLWRKEAGALAGINTSLDALAWLYAAKGQWGKALQLAGAAEALRQQQGVHIWPIYAEETARRLAPARAALGEARANEEFVAGGRLSMDVLIQMARELSGETPPDAARPVGATESAPSAAVTDLGLTQREQEIIRWLAQGLTAREIGQRLFLSPRTIEKHEENVRNKLGVPNRAALIAWAAQHGLALSKEEP